jgi:hypothetical protein
MFIKDGKSLFNNTGLIIAIIILVILLVISYNKCMAPIELFDPTIAQSTTASLITPEPKDVRVSIMNGNIALNFTINTTNNEPIPTKFLVVLAQYDSAFKNTGNNKFYLSNEYEINTAVSATQSTYQTNLCTLINGLPSCKYLFTNLDKMDANGNLYNYKIGVAAVYDWGNSKFVIPYNVTNTNKLFTLESSIEQQDNLYNEFLEYKKQKQTTTQLSGQTPNANTMATADGQYEMIKSQLGNYPSNLVLDPESSKQNLLSDLVDKPMVQGLLNVNVAVNKPVSNQ